MATEKSSVHQIEHVVNDGVSASPDHEGTNNSGESGLPVGYFRSPRFIGSYLAICLNLTASTGGFALVAPVIAEINAAVGPSESIIWLALVYTVCLAVGLLSVGRLSDLFGRRWFWITGTALGAVGAIVAGSANSVPVVIGGQTLISMSACTGISYASIMGELVPMKYRFLANAGIFVTSMPTGGFGAVVSTSLIVHTKAGWRWVYYLLTILNGLTSVLYAIFYFPPTFHEKHRSARIIDFIKNFDLFGLALYIVGLGLFILGLSSGGSAYPWDDPKVIAFLVVGLVCLVCLFVYESRANLKEPLIPMHFFADRGYVASMISLSLGASAYYSQAVIWPAMAANVYGQGRTMWVGWVASLVGVGITLGEVTGSTLAKPLKYTKWQCVFVFSFGTLFLGLMSLNDIDTPGRAIGLVFAATILIGYNEALVLPICGIRIRDQRDIGSAVGVAGSSRSAISTLASTIYTVVLTARLKQTVPNIVGASVLNAGLPAASLPAYLEAMAAGGTSKALAAVNGLDSAIEAAGALGYRHAYLAAYRTVFFTSIGFGIIGIIATCFVPNVDKQLTETVAATVYKRKNGLVEDEKSSG